MKIDSHQHFWRYTPEEYGWIDASMASIRRDFLPEELAGVIAPLGIDGTVAVQARQNLEETQWLLKLAEANPFIKGVVGWAPLSDPKAGEALDSLGKNPHLKGLRHVLQGEPDGFMAGPAFNAGLSLLAARGLVYDILIVARQLPEALALVDRHPNQRFVLDHIAKPRVEGTPPADWRRLIVDLSRRENVTCKFSGVVTEVPGRTWTAELLRPYFATAFEAFGAERLMFGSDWPVCLNASDYARWFHFVESCGGCLSAAEKERFFGGTAAEVYKL